MAVLARPDEFSVLRRDRGIIRVVRLLSSILAGQLLHVLAAASGTLSPSTQLQQPRQLWEGRADSELKAVGGRPLTLGV